MQDANPLKIIRNKNYYIDTTFTNAQVKNIKTAEDNIGKLNSISLNMTNTEKILGIQPESYDSLVKNIFNFLKN